MRVNRFGKEVMATRKMLYTYIFVRDTEAGVRELKHFIPQLHMLSHPGGDLQGRRRYMTVSDREMDMFRIIADAFSGQLPCYRFDEVDLEEGDLVQVVGGVFDGVEGRLRCTRGREGGQVLLALGNLLLVSTGDIAPQFIRILEFGKGNRHPYRQFETHLPRAVAALAKRLTDGTLPVEDLPQQLVFTGRFALLKPRTLIVESSHAGLMLMSYTALNDRDEARRWLDTCRDILPRLTAPLQIGLHLAMMYAATGDRQLAARLAALTAAWLPVGSGELKKRTVIDIFNKFQSIYETSTMRHANFVG